MTRESFIAVSATGDITELRAFYAKHKWDALTVFYIKKGSLNASAEESVLTHLTHISEMRSFVRVHFRLFDKSRPTPLHEAAHLGHLRTVRFLIEEVGCNLPVLSSFCLTSPLHEACRAGHLGIVRYILRAYPSMINSEELLSGDTPLITAALKGHLPVVKFICESPGVNLNSKHLLDDTSILGVACGHSHLEMVRYLSTVPGIMMEEDKKSGRPLSAACSRGNLEMVRFLIEELNFNPSAGGRFHTFHPLYNACWGGNHKIVDYLLQFPGIDVNESSALASAAEKDHLLAVKMLLACQQQLEYKYDSPNRVLCVKYSRPTVCIPEIHSLLEEYTLSPDATRLRLQSELGIPDKKAADFFSLMVFFCDDFFRLRPLQ